MIRPALALGLVILATAMLFAQPVGGGYAPEGGNFSIKFPAKPKETKQVAKSVLGELKVFTASFANAEGNAYLASYTDFPAGTAKPEGRDAIIDGVRQTLKGKDGKVLSDTDIAVGTEKLPGHELVAEQGKVRLRFRVVLRDDRLYQYAVVGTTAFVTSGDATKFLDSFTLTR